MPSPETASAVYTRNSAYRQNALAIRAVQLVLCIAIAGFVLSLPAWQDSGSFSLIFSTSVITGLLTILFYIGSFLIRRRIESFQDSESDDAPSQASDGSSVTSLTPSQAEFVATAMPALAGLEIAVATLQLMLTFAAGCAAAALLGTKSRLPVCDGGDCAKALLATILDFVLSFVCLVLLIWLCLQRYMGQKAQHAQQAKHPEALQAATQAAERRQSPPPDAAMAPPPEAMPGGPPEDAVIGSGVCGVLRSDNTRFALINAGLRALQVVLGLVVWIVFLALQSTDHEALDVITFMAAINMAVAVAMSLMLVWEGLRVGECGCCGVSVSFLHVYVSLVVDLLALLLLWVANCAGAAVASAEGCEFKGCSEGRTISAMGFLMFFSTLPSFLLSTHAREEYSKISQGLMPASLYKLVLESDKTVCPPMPKLPAEQA